MMRSTFKRLLRDEKGVSIIEFAYIAPTFLVLMMGAFDMGHRTYVSSILNGEVQKAGRAGTIEGGGDATEDLDDKVKDKTSRVVSNGTWTFERKFYPSFTRAGQAENFTDGNGDGLRNAGECFQDENGNGLFDKVSGRGGQGGADDIVVYTATVCFPRLFPMAGLLGWSPNQTETASTVLRNQPYGNQNVTTPVAVCS